MYLQYCAAVEALNPARNGGSAASSFRSLSRSRFRGLFKRSTQPSTTTTDRALRRARRRQRQQQPCCGLDMDSVDKFSAVAFPVSFLIFNIAYWGYYTWIINLLAKSDSA